jgi:glycosyltransferase involved in cell wall biosynthesis
MILVGTRTTLEQLPLHLHSRCKLLTYAGVEHHEFRPPLAPRSNRVPQLLFAGRLIAYKGVELLLRAAALAKTACRFELKIVGGGNPTYRKYCHVLAADLGLVDTVEFSDRQPRDKLMELYRAADVFCMPSVETYGIAILEAMSSGCAVLVSDINGPGEIVHSGTGVKVRFEDPDQFIAEYADRIVELVGSVELRRKLGTAAREHVVRHHDWRDIQARLLEIYERLFSQRSAQRPVISNMIATA